MIFSTFRKFNEDSDDEVEEKDIPNNDYVEDSSDDEEWVAEDARLDAIPEIAYDK